MEQRKTKGEKRGRQAEEHLDLLLSRRKALSVIRSCLKLGQLSVVFRCPPGFLSMGQIRKRASED